MMCPSTPLPGRFSIGLAGILVIVGASAARLPAAPAPTETTTNQFCPVAGDAVVTRILKPIRQQYDVPAMAAALVTDEGIKAVGAVGVRKRGTQVAVTLDDLWHLGSDTKAMTATLLARLIERGRLRWETPLAEVFPEVAGSMHPDFQPVTVLQLLSHHAGLPTNLDLGAFGGNDVAALRQRAVREYLAAKPLSPPGSRPQYSNLGYIIAGAVVERTTGNTWEHAMKQEIFGPLKMNSAGFGGTGTPGQLDQPWPHHADGQPASQHGPSVDNPPVMGPAGRVHCTIQDWARFIQDQLRGARGEPALLKPGSYQRLHTPPFGGDQALGWLAVERSWGRGTVLNHCGDNTMNFANMWLAPHGNFAVLVCVNQGGEKAFLATDDAVSALIELHRTTPPPQQLPKAGKASVRE